jgi:Asp-tRNA(Asn)/Glu-tRNA(Gln) amidotransferase C subunit
MATIEDLDLDIDNYNLDDILNLFKINSDFDENDLKQAKKIVLQIHPDKSRLPAKYFIFYSKAYKVLYNIHEFRNKSSNKKEENYSILSNEDKNKALQNFFDKNKSLKNPQGFNAWFNEQFEKNKIALESEETGYGDWLRSEEDLEPEKKISQAEMAIEFDKKKKQVRSLVVHKDISDVYANNLGGSNLSNNAPEEFSSDLFSNLSYQDLKQAHTESVIPVTEEDYYKVKKFNNVNEYVNYRSTQDTKPLSEMQAMEYLKNKSRIDDQEASKRAYELAKQVEQSKQNSKSFWGNILKIADKQS